MSSFLVEYTLYLYMLACLSSKGAIPILGWSIDACDYSEQPTLRSWGACVRP